MIDQKQIKKILVVSLTNIGDIILTFPVIDILKRDFPEARLDLVIGPKGESLFKDDPAFGKIYLYRKNESPLAILRGIKELADQHYGLVVDLRNSAIPFMIFAKYRTPIMFVRPQGLHMREQHLSRLRSIHAYRELARPGITFERASVAVPDGQYAVIAPGSRAENKRWQEQGFAKLADRLAERYGMKIVFAGDEADVAIVSRIKAQMKYPPVDLSGKLSLAQLGRLMSKAALAIVNDSAPLHLASYLNVPVAAFFGPTDPRKYGPWGDKKIVVRKNSGCAACSGDKSRAHDCIQAVSFEDAIAVLDPWLKEVLNGK